MREYSAAHIPGALLMVMCPAAPRNNNIITFGSITTVLLLSQARGERSDSGGTDRDFAVGDPTFELRCDSVYICAHAAPKMTTRKVIKHRQQQK
jgi:hypothetical protein